jgi:hypothetical protein
MVFIKTKHCFPTAHVTLASFGFPPTAHVTLASFGFPPTAHVALARLF